MRTEKISDYVFGEIEDGCDDVLWKDYSYLDELAKGDDDVYDDDDDDDYEYEDPDGVPAGYMLFQIEDAIYNV